MVNFNQWDFIDHYSPLLFQLYNLEKSSLKKKILKSLFILVIKNYQKLIFFEDP